MGKWLSVLKNIKNKELPNTQNPQNSKKCIFDDFEGSEYEQKQEKNNASHLCDDDQTHQIEERAAVLEYDGGYLRDEAERIAGIKTSTPMLTNVNIFNDAMSVTRLKNVETFNRPKQPQPYLETHYDGIAKPDDDETYLKALQLHGAMSYGMAMRVLGWGGTRAAKAEDRLRKSGRIAYGKHGRAVVVSSDTGGKEL